jgi:hypothetical protein
MAVSVAKPPSSSSAPAAKFGKDFFVDALEAELKERILSSLQGERSIDINLVDEALDASDFIRLGLPPRPTDPAALQLWLEMIPRKLKLVPPFPEGRITFRTDMAIGLARDVAGSDRDDDGGYDSAGIVPRGRLGSSRNWSGAAIFANHGNRFVQVIGSWTVPDVRAGKGEGPWVCSTWIGIDGLRRWMKSMPQMGTAQVVGDTGEVDEHGMPLPKYFAWFQWWLLGRGIQIPVVLPVPTGPGKKVFCCVTLLPPDQPNPGDRYVVQFFLNVDGIGSSLQIKPPPNNDPLTAPSERPGVPARGASAEWILERPTALRESPNGNVKEGALFPLPDFGSAGADDFVASLAPDPDPTVVAAIAAKPITPSVNFRTPVKLRMMERQREPTGMVVIAKPVEANGGKVTVVYKE